MKVVENGGRVAEVVEVADVAKVVVRGVKLTEAVTVVVIVA